jgi:hypothetical protein
MGNRGVVLLVVLAMAAWSVVWPAGVRAAPASSFDFTGIGSLVEPSATPTLQTTAVMGVTALAGAPDTTISESGQGAIFADTESQDGWDATATQATLQAADPQAEDGLGGVVQTEESTLVTGSSKPGGSGDIWVFNAPNGGWSGTVTQSATLGVPNHALLYAPVISGGTIVALGEVPGTSGAAGQVLAYVFDEPVNGWTGTVLPSAVLVPPNGASITGSGSSVMIGEHEIVAGSSGASSAFVFSEPRGGWSGVISPAAALTAPGVSSLGWSVAFVGATVVAGPSEGSAGDGAYAFAEPASGWASEGPTAELSDTSVDGELFPSTIAVGAGALVASGSTLLVPVSVPTTGGPETGYAVYDMPSGGWSGADVEPDATLALGTSLPLQSAAFDASGVVAGANSTAALGPTAISLGGVSAVFSDVGTATGTPAATAELVGAADTGQQLTVFSEPVTGWTSRGATVVESLPDAFSGTAPTSFSVSGSIVAISWADAENSPSRSYLYAQPSTGWSADASPIAELNDPNGWPLSDVRVSGDEAVAVGTAPVGTGQTPQQEIDVFTAPAGGWDGIVDPVARLGVDGSVNAFAISGPAVAVSETAPVPTITAPTARKTLVEVDVAGSGSWSDARGIAVDTLNVPGPAAAGPISFSGDDVVAGAVAGANLLATANGAAVYVPDRDGRYYASMPTATLAVPSDGAWIFREPVNGWRGALKPSAHIAEPVGDEDPASYSVASISDAANEIAVSENIGSDEGCSNDLQVVSRPAGGWTGTLTGRAPGEATLGGGGPCGGPDYGSISGGVFDRSDLLVGTRLGVDDAGTVDVYSAAGAPAGSRPASEAANVSSASLVGGANGSPTLEAGVSAGTNEASLTSITIDAPTGLSFVRTGATLKRDIAVCRETGVACTVRRADELRLTINAERNDRRTEIVTVGPRVLRESASLKRRLSRAPRALRLGVTVTDAMGRSVARTVVVRAASARATAGPVQLAISLGTASVQPPWRSLRCSRSRCSACSRSNRRRAESWSRPARSCRRRRIRRERVG